MTIWYVFARADGSFQGSGTVHFDDELYGSTTTPTPDYDEDGAERPFWNGEAWELR